MWIRPKQVVELLLEPELDAGPTVVGKVAELDYPGAHAWNANAEAALHHNDVHAELAPPPRTGAPHSGNRAGRGGICLTGTKGVGEALQNGGIGSRLDARWNLCGELLTWGSSRNTRHGRAR